MRNKSSLLQKSLKYLEKAFDLFGRGRKQALNFQVGQVRMDGRDILSPCLSEDGKEICFNYKDEGVILKLEDFKSFRRLRTKRYLFIFEGEKKNAKPFKPQKGEKVKPAQAEKTEEKEEEKTEKVEESAENSEKPEKKPIKKKAPQKKKAKKKTSKKSQKGA